MRNVALTLFFSLGSKNVNEERRQAEYLQRYPPLNLMYVVERSHDPSTVAANALPEATLASGVALFQLQPRHNFIAAISTSQRVVGDDGS